MPQNSPSGLLRTRVYRKIDRNSAVFKAQRPTQRKILDADIDEFISNLSPDTSDMSDDSDFEFDDAILDKWVAQNKPDVPDMESMEYIFNIIIKKMPPVIQYPVVQIKRVVTYWNQLYKANIKLINAVFVFFSKLMAWIIHFLFILSTSYKNILLSTYKLIVKVDAWMDRILDDRTVPKENSMMSETVRDKIAESMKLSKKPISAKRARELMLHPAASKLRNDAGQGQFWQWLHGYDTNDHGRSKATSGGMAYGMPNFDMKFPGMNMNLPDMNNMKLPDIDMKLPDIDFEEKMKSGKKAIGKLNKGLTSIGNKFTGMFKSKEPEKIEPPPLPENDDSPENIIRQEIELQKSAETLSLAKKSNPKVSKPKPSSTKEQKANTTKKKVSSPRVSNAKLSSPRVSNAKMSSPRVSNAKMSSAKLSKANISKARFSACRVPSYGENLKNAELKQETVEHITIEH